MTGIVLKVSAMKRGNALTKTKPAESILSFHDLHFFYDAQNRPAVVVYNGTAYAYVKNLQGDIVGILDNAGNWVVEYTYDAWGAPTSRTGSMADTLGVINPFRYRGYVFDQETGLYYVTTRYYAANISRYITPDKYDVLEADLLSRADKNIYAYCDNNPIIRIDEDGEFWNFVIGGIVGGLIGGISAAMNSYKNHGEVTLSDVALGVAVGAIGGLVGATSWNQWLQASISGILNAAQSCIDAIIHDDPISVKGLMIDFAIGATSSLIGSKATNKASSQAKRLVQKGKARLSRNEYSPGKYYKGGAKRANAIIAKGTKALNTAQGQASVIGSAIGGSFSVVKILVVE